MTKEKDPEDYAPMVPKDLLDHLAVLYPDRCPNLTDSDREVWHKTGAASVVNYLRRLHAQQSAPTRVLKKP